MDIFSIDSILESIEKNKTQIKKELDMKILDNDKLSLESDQLLQVLDYTPKTRYSEKELMSSIPIIKLKSPKIEKKPPKKNKHIKLVSTPNIDIDSLSINKNNNLCSNKNLKLQIANKDNTEKKVKEDKKEENDDEEDEEYEKQFAQREKYKEEKEKKNKNLNSEENELFRHRTTKALNIQEFMEALDPVNNKMEIEVYIFGNKENKINISITDKDRVKDIKKIIIQNLIDKKQDLKYTSYKAYNITIIESKSKNNQKEIPLENNLILFDLKPTTISFFEKENINIAEENKGEKIINDIQNTEIKQEKVDIKINYNIDGTVHTKIINISLEDNLKRILNIFFDENILKDKNVDLYYFIDNKKNKEIENAIDLDTNIKNLPSYELNLCQKDNIINNNKEILFISDEENKEEKKEEEKEEKKEEKKNN